ncbi:hypothetical protein ACLOJK_029655, partial [Asimina triloba]
MDVLIKADRNLLKGGALMTSGGRPKDPREPFEPLLLHRWNMPSLSVQYGTWDFFSSSWLALARCKDE